MLPSEYQHEAANLASQPGVPANTKTLLPTLRYMRHHQQRPQTRTTQLTQPQTNVCLALRHMCCAPSLHARHFHANAGTIGPEGTGRMKVAGIDFSTHDVDIVLIPLEGTSVEWHRFELTGQDAFDRTRMVAAVIPRRNAAFWDDVLAIGIEEPTGMFKPGLGYRVQGAILSCLPPGRVVKPWPPSSWRKGAGLSGRASKADVYEFTAKQHRPSWVKVNAGLFGHSNSTQLVWPQDACDAFCIAFATLQAISREVTA